MTAASRFDMYGRERKYKKVQTVDCLMRDPMATNSLISYASCNCVGAAVDSATMSNLAGFAALGSTPWVSFNFYPPPCWNIRRLCERAQCPAIPGISSFLLFSFILRAVGPYLSFSAFIM
jgi:hypothetical protein